MGGIFGLFQHQGQAIAPEHDETRRFAPEPVVAEAEGIAIMVGGRHDIAHQQHGGRCDEAGAGHLPCVARIFTAKAPNTPAKV